jgi:lipopolysaccharide export system permease protein
MINILDRYLFLQVLAGTILVMLVLVSLDAFISFINELDDVGRGHYGHLQAALYILFTIPRRLYEYAPTSILIGGLLSLGSMAGHGELTAIRAAGLSVYGVARSVMKAGVVFVVLVFILGESIAPVTEQKGQTLRKESITEKQAVQSASGLWLKYADLFIQTGSILGENDILGLSIFRFDGTRLVEIVRAESARRNEKGWVLKDVKKLTIEPHVLHQQHLTEEQWPNFIAKQLFEVLRVNPDEMAARDLSDYIDYLRENALESGQYRLAFWNRFMIPLSSLVMLLLALPFVFGSQRTGGAGQRLFVGVLLGVGYFLISRLINQMGVVYGFPPFLSAIFPVLLFLSIAIILLRRV